MTSARRKDGAALAAELCLMLQRRAGGRGRGSVADGTRRRGKADAAVLYPAGPRPIIKQQCRRLVRGFLILFSIVLFSYKWNEGIPYAPSSLLRQPACLARKRLTTRDRAP